MACGLALLTTDLEEDITKVLPANKQIQKFNEGFLDSELSNRLILHLSTTDERYADSLTLFCQLFVDALESSPSKDLVKSISYKMDPGLYQNLSTLVLDNLPLFLDDKHYQELEARLAPESIKERVTGAYKALNSPAGFAFKKIIRKDPLGISNFVFDELTNFQLDDNFELYDNYLLTKDRKHLLFFISPEDVGLQAANSAQLIKEVERIGERYDQRFLNCDFSFFGGSVISLANADRIRKDVTLTVTIALLFLFLLISYYYKDWKVKFYILLPVIGGGAIALAIMGFLKPAISIIAVGVGSVLIGISIDFSIHLFTHFRQKNDVQAVYKDVSLPIMLSALTTSSAFLCLYLVRSEAMQDLGIFAALSIFSSAILALLLQPHFFKHSKATISNNTFVDKIAAVPYEKQKWLVLAIIAIFIGLSFYATEVTFESDLNKINYMPKALVEAEDGINAISDASKRGIFLISFGGDINEALENSAQLVPKLEKLKSESKIESYTSPNQLISSESQQQEKIAKWKAFWNEERKTAVKANILNYTSALNFKATAFSPFYDLMDKSFKTIPPVELDKSTGGMLSDYFTTKEASATTSTMIRLNSDQKKYVHEAFSELDKVSIIDKEYLVHEFVETLRSDFSKLVWISLLVVFITLHLVYGRAELALVAFLPICYSWTITLGMMNVLGLKFNIVNIIITSFIFGLGIDYSIFIMRGLQQKYRTGVDNLSSYKASILLSSLTTLIGIGVLLFAQHPALKSIASISLIGIFSVLLVSFTIQPLLFRWLTEKDGKFREYPLTILNMGKTLWVYFTLLFGCIILSIISLILILLFFIPLRIRKSFLHHCIYWASKTYLRLSFLNRYTIHNKYNESFKKPAIVVANHRSLIDTPVMFSMTPKILIVTNDWVRNSPIYRIVCYLADFHSISQGADVLLERLEGAIADGYSIAIFPEGTRAPSDKMLRFRKGAFLLAEKAKMDIVPVFIHGTKDFLGKNKFWGRANEITTVIDNRIPYGSNAYGTDYSAVTKQFSKWFRGRYAELREELEDLDYNRDAVLYNYIYKGPVTEWYTKVKTKMEGNYVLFDKLIPDAATVYDLGCGYGYMTYFLSRAKKERNFISIDYDEDKIAVAQNCAINSDQTTFVAADITNYPLEQADVFLLSDVVHYLTPDQQISLLDACADQLNPSGKIILRDGDADKQERIKGTKLTELFSTGSGFNKTQNELSFLSGEAIRAWAEKRGFSVETIDETKYTSNVIFVMQKE